MLPHWRHDARNAQAVSYMTTFMPMLVQEAETCNVTFVELIATNWRSMINQDPHQVPGDVMDWTQGRFDRARELAGAGDGPGARAVVEEVMDTWYRR